MASCSVASKAISKLRPWYDWRHMPRNWAIFGDISAMCCGQPTLRQHSIMVAMADTAPSLTCWKEEKEGVRVLRRNAETVSTLGLSLPRKLHRTESTLCVAA